MCLKFGVLDKQVDIFRRQLGLAVTLDLPVIVHSREAEEDVLVEIQRYKVPKMSAAEQRNSFAIPLIQTPDTEQNNTDGRHMGSSKNHQNQDFGFFGKTKKLRGVIHCFTGTEPFARKVLECGFYISFSGIITFPSAQELREVVKEIPLDRILVETDSPLIAPQSHRGERNEPAYVKEVIDELAKIKSLTPEEVEKVTTQNAKNLFRID